MNFYSKTRLSINIRTNNTLKHTARCQKPLLFMEKDTRVSELYLMELLQTKAEKRSGKFYKRKGS